MKLVRRVPKTILIRKVPNALHRKMKARAKRSGISLSDYLLSEFRERAEIKEIAEKLTLTKFRKRLGQGESR